VLNEQNLEAVISRNVEMYVVEMVVTSHHESTHHANLKNVCSVSRQKSFLDFIEQRIKAKPKKCVAIINMRSPTNIKEG